MKFHHVAFTVSSIEESIQWYQQKLGFKLLDRYDKNNMEIAILKRDDITIEFFNFKNETIPLPDYRKSVMSDLHTVGTKHLCLEVDDLDEMIKELKDKAVEVQGEIDTTFFGGRYIFIKDCSGNLVELYQS